MPPLIKKPGNDEAGQSSRGGSDDEEFYKSTDLKIQMFRYEVIGYCTSFSK